MRGNRGRGGGLRSHPGSIPACAGEPPGPGPARRRTRVYPRVCGGTTGTSRATRGTSGLSPRVRGNRKGPAGPRHRPGSIPACAGEPDCEAAEEEMGWVYPRVCGGTLWRASMICKPGGLSPRVRGNRIARPLRKPRKGSIPACAGEPRPIRPCGSRSRVYPRVCGGTIHEGVPQAWMYGLSPRVRGNPRVGVWARRSQRSIPACAGEPTSTPRGTSTARVYPRVCGGTPRRRRCRRQWPGLSPRVRGNRFLGAAARQGPGSIPACAGEPRVRETRTARSRVYPRVCGGTGQNFSSSQQGTGLSPRVRGNPAPGC